MMKLVLSVFIVLPFAAWGCTTIAVGAAATADGSVLLAHSNDGDGDVAGNLMRVDAADWPPAARRPVSGGFIPQIAHTFAYFTKVGGYASLNEHQVGLAESTCNGVTKGNSSGLLNIVDLSAIGLERANSSRTLISIIGQLAETYGYNDNAESLLVGDPAEVFIFHILPDSTARSAVWVAERVPDTAVAVVANAFTVRVVTLDDPSRFLFSANLPAEARQRGWAVGTPLDFTRLFSGPELGHKYATGRRMWAVLSRLSSLPASQLPEEYGEYVSSAPYPATATARWAGLHLSRPKRGVPARAGTLSVFDVFAAMRDFYANTPYDMGTAPKWRLSGGPFGSPDRWARVPVSARGAWERTIATSKTILSYVLVLRGWLPHEIGGLLWIAPHAAHTSLYVPLVVGMSSSEVPLAWRNNSLSRVDRGIGAFQASRFVYNAAQMRFSVMYPYIAAQQLRLETAAATLQKELDILYLKTRNIREVSIRYAENCAAMIQSWWLLSDELVLHYGADASCSQCEYPAWWLDDVNFAGGPPPSPAVPPYPRSCAV